MGVAVRWGLRGGTQLLWRRWPWSEFPGKVILGQGLKVNWFLLGEEGKAYSRPRYSLRGGVPETLSSVSNLWRELSIVLGASIAGPRGETGGVAVNRGWSHCCSRKPRARVSLQTGPGQAPCAQHPAHTFLSWAHRGSGHLESSCWKPSFLDPYCSTFL